MEQGELSCSREEGRLNTFSPSPSLSFASESDERSLDSLHRETGSCCCQEVCKRRCKRKGIRVIFEHPCQRILSKFLCENAYLSSKRSCLPNPCSSKQVMTLALLCNLSASSYSMASSDGDLMKLLVCGLDNTHHTNITLCASQAHALTHAC